MGAALYGAGQFDEALKQFEKSEMAFKPVAWDWLFRAMIQSRLGHTEEARKLLARARQAIADADAVKPGADTGKTSGWNNTYERPTIMLLLAEAEALVYYDPIFPADPFAR